jgi:hypothetical protein|tara:strand:- start:848 stop:2797 length:1950 start_codon:yes stop_codon:yes gene_type:complete
MATLTAGNFYWAGYKPLGPRTGYQYVRGNTFHGVSGYNWSATGNWFVKYYGYTGDDSFQEGGYTQGFYFDDAPRVPHEGDNVYFDRLTPDMPGIDGHYPTSECLFGGVTGPRDGTSGGTWENGDGTVTQLVGNLALIEVSESYANNRGSSFALGNEFGATFGQAYMGVSASVAIAGLAGLSGSTGTLIFTNSDQSIVKFAGNTAYGYTMASGTIGTAGDMYGRTGYYIIGTEGFTGGPSFTGGSTLASLALHQALVAAITAGDLKMAISDWTSTGPVGGTAYPNSTPTFTLTQGIPGGAGNTEIKGSLMELPKETNDAGGEIGTAGSAITAGNSGNFSGGTDNDTENPLNIKSDYLISHGDNPIHFTDSELTRGFILGSGQFNYNRGSINQLIYDRQSIDYIGPPRTASYLLDTELSNSVVISGGTFQSKTEYDDESDTFITTDDVSGTRPITYIRASGNIGTVEVDAFRRGTVRIEGEATTLNVHPEKEHPNGVNYQGVIDIRRPLNFSDRYTYSTIEMKSYNANEAIAGTTLNSRISLNAGLTIDTLNIGAGTVFVGPVVGDREITVVDGSISGRGVLKARSEFNPSYQGFKIGEDFSATGEGMLISDPDARIEFSTGHYVLASFSDGNTGADTAFTKPGTPIPPKL